MPDARLQRTRDNYPEGVPQFGTRSRQFFVHVPHPGMNEPEPDYGFASAMPPAGLTPQQRGQIPAPKYCSECVVMLPAHSYSCSRRFR